MSDALYQRKPVFDSLAEGLKACGILKLMRNFPSCFVSLFVSTGDLSNDDVCQALYNNQPMEDQDIAIKHLTKFVKNLDQEGKLCIGACAYLSCAYLSITCGL